MNRSRRQDAINPKVLSFRRQEPLSDLRYQDLLKSASALFASAEEITAGARSAAIDEINELMARYGLTVDDFR